MALTEEEIERYKRHLVLREVGGQGQQKLKAAKVLVVGAGGLGSPVLMYLAAAGVGTLGLIDDDRVSLDNLQRQIVHDTPHIGASKVASAKEAIAKLNPHVRVETWEERIDARNALDRIARYALSPTARIISPPAIW
jgi:adenylyltransferase/sulfurtransferase